MNSIRCAACALALGFLAPAWAINKCTDATGKVSFQDAPCAGQGETVEVRPAMEGGTPIRPAPSAATEGAFGPTWQRKNYLQTQGVPQARATLERHLRECAAPPAQVAAEAGPLRRSLASGSMVAQEREAATAKLKADCDARAAELRTQLKALEDELGAL